MLNYFSQGGVMASIFIFAIFAPFGYKYLIFKII